jgi:UCH-binding domain
LQSILSGIKVPAGASGPDVDLSLGITGEVLQPLLENEEFVRKMKDLLPSVSGDEAGEDPASEIKSTVQSPQVIT